MRPLLPDHLKRQRTPRERALVITEALSVGLPFAAFKALAGLAIWHHWSLLRPVAVAILALAALDLLINVLNVFAVAIRGRRWLPVCTLQALTLRVRPSHRSAEVGTALDVLTSFVLLAGMIGFGFLAGLSPLEHQIWDVSVILNVLGAGALRLTDAVATPSESRPTV